MCGACKPPISATTRISVLYCSHFMCFVCICPHYFSHVFCTVVTSFSLSTAIIVILPLYLILLQIGPMAEHCLILETIWMWLSTVYLSILSLSLHHPNSYPPQPERVRNSMFLTKPAFGLTVVLCSVKLHIAGHQGPSPCCREIVHIVQHRRLTSFPRIGF